MRKLIIYILAFLLLKSLSYTQQQQQPESQSKPLELPNYIIQGKGQVNVQSGIKQFPEQIINLSKTELDSINSLQKEQSFLLPPKTLPTRIFEPIYPIGYVRAEAGMFFTPSIEGGYKINLDRYRIFGNAGIDLSNGHITNSNYFKTFIRLNSEYIAPDKFWIFGGSKTTTNLNFNTRSYRLYASKSAPERTLSEFGVGVRSDGLYQGFDFSTGGNYNLSILNQNTSSSNSNVLAFLKAQNNWSNFRLGGNVSIDLNGYNGNWSSLFQVNAISKYLVDKFIFSGEAGLQFGNASANSSLFNFLVNLDCIYHLNDDISLKGIFKNNMENNNFRSFITQNPYLSDTLKIDFSRNTELKVIGYYHPSEEFYFSLGLQYQLLTRTPFFVNADTGSFIVKYQDANKLNFVLDGYYNLNKYDNFIYNATLTLANLTGGNTIPYSVPAMVNIGYIRKWTQEFETTVNLGYIGTRYADTDNKIVLSGYLDMNLNLDYKFNEKFSIFGKIQNMTNSSIYIWNGYRERDLYLALGLQYKFY